METKQRGYKSLLQALGPGILFASTAIGVSHLVQSTRAGATYGFALLWAVILANVFKYPFFEYGSRYANATGESIIDGYKRIGTWMLGLYFLITLCSMFFVTAAVGFVTAGFMENLFGVSRFTDLKLLTTLVLFIVCVIILIAGKYSALDKMIKVIGSVLLISTLIAFILTLINGPIQQMASFEAPVVWSNSGILFIIALMGWMPTAVDLSAWNSLWTIERIKQTGYHPSLKETLFDFNFGYWISAILSICFVTLGAYLMYGSGVEMPAGSAGFANKVVELYTANIGQWSYFIIAAAAFCIMFGTSIAVFDGYARSIERTFELLFFKEADQEKLLESRKFYIIGLLVIAIGAFIIISQFTSNLKQLVDLATTISFLIAPLIAIVNFTLVTKYIKEEARPSTFMCLLSYAGIAFLIGFGVLFVVVKLGLVVI